MNVEAYRSNNSGIFSEDSNMQTSHYHDTYEIYYFLGEQMTYFLDSKTIRLKKFDVLLVDKYKYHRTFYEQKGGLERINVSFSDDFLNLHYSIDISQKISALFKTPCLSITDSKIKSQINEMFNNLCDAIYQRDEICKLKGSFILCELLLTFVQLSANFSQDIDINDLSSVEKKVSDIVLYINSNYNENISLESLSKKFFLNKYYLCHIFKVVTGLGVTDFINKKRISEAVILLKHLEMSLTEIQQKVGFNSQSYFIQVFKKFYHMTPSCYRKKFPQTYGT